MRGPGLRLAWVPLGQSVTELLTVFDIARSLSAPRSDLAQRNQAM